MMICYLRIIDYLTGMNRYIPGVIQSCCRLIHQLWQGRSHILREESAVRPRISDQLLFIQALQGVQRLLCGIAQHLVRIPLQGSQIIEKRRFFRFFFCFNAVYTHLMILPAFCGKNLCVCLV